MDGLLVGGVLVGPQDELARIAVAEAEGEQLPVDARDRADLLDPAELLEQRGVLLCGQLAPAAVVHLANDLAAEGGGRVADLAPCTAGGAVPADGWPGNLR